MPRALLAVLFSLAVPSLAAAQPAADSAGPRRGTWGAEVGFGDGTSASLLRFRSARSAWVLGLIFFGSVERREEPAGPFDPGVIRETTGSFAVAARAGMRRWRDVRAPLRPYGGVALTGSYQDDENVQAWSAGVVGELGATYFFTPHVSLGAAGEVGASYFDREFDPGFRDSGVTVRGLVARVTGAVYF